MASKNRLMSVRNTGVRLIIAVWVGSLWTVGYMVAPGLFAILDDRALAGTLAGEFFRLEALLSLACGGLLAAIWLSGGDTRRQRKLELALVAFIVVLAAAGEWGVRPFMDSARAAGDGSRFAALHGVSATLYLLASLAGIVLVVSTGRREL